MNTLTTPGWYDFYTNDIVNAPKSGATLAGQIFVKSTTWQTAQFVIYRDSNEIYFRVASYSSLSRTPWKQFPLT